MRRFLLKSICYIFFLMLLAIGLDVLITHGLMKVENYMYKPWIDIQKENMNYDVIIMGNSRAQGHIHPAILDSICECNSYNLGTEAYHSDLHILKYHYYVQHNAKPKLIVYQVDLATFHPTVLKNIANAEQFLPLFYDDYLRKEFVKYGYNQWDLYCPLYRYFTHHRAIWWGITEGLGIMHINKNPEYKGFRMGYESNEESTISFDNNRDELAKIDMSNSFSKSSIELVAFEEFVKECQKDSIDLLLVFSPMYSSVTSQLSDKIEFDEYMLDIVDKYNLSYIDYTSDTLLCSNSKYFATAGHMNYYGAKVFTTRLSYDIDSIGYLR